MSNIKNLAVGKTDEIGIFINDSVVKNDQQQHGPHQQGDLLFATKEQPLHSFSLEPSYHKVSLDAVESKPPEATFTSDSTNRSFKLAFVVSFIACCCCWVLGIPACFLAKKAKDAYKIGMKHNSYILLRYSYLLSMLGIFAGMLLMGIYLVNENECMKYLNDEWLNNLRQHKLFLALDSPGESKTSQKMFA